VQEKKAILPYTTDKYIADKYKCFPP